MPPQEQLSVDNYLEYQAEYMDKNQLFAIRVAQSFSPES